MTLGNTTRFQWDKSHNRFYLASEPTLLLKKLQIKKSKKKKKTVAPIANKKKQQELSSERWETLLHPWQRNVVSAHSFNLSTDETKEKRKSKKTKTKTKTNTNTNTKSCAVNDVGICRPKTSQSLPKSTVIEAYRQHPYVSLNIHRDKGKEKKQKKRKKILKQNQSSRQDEEKLQSQSKLKYGDFKIRSNLSPFKSENYLNKKLEISPTPDAEKLTCYVNEKKKNVQNNDYPELEDEIMWSWSQSHDVEDKNYEVNWDDKDRAAKNTEENGTQADANILGKEEEGEDEEEWCWELSNDGFDSPIEGVSQNNKINDGSSNHFSLGSKIPTEREMENIPEDYGDDKRSICSSPSDETVTIDGVVTEIHTIHEQEKHNLLLALDNEKIRQKANLLERRKIKNRFD